MAPSSTLPSGNSSVKELAHLYKQHALERLGSSKGREKKLAKTMLVIAAHLHWAIGMVACSIIPSLLTVFLVSSSCAFHLGLFIDHCMLRVNEILSIL